MLFRNKVLPTNEQMISRSRNQTRFCFLSENPLSRLPYLAANGLSFGQENISYKRVVGGTKKLFWKRLLKVGRSIFAEESTYCLYNNGRGGPRPSSGLHSITAEMRLQVFMRATY